MLEMEMRHQEELATLKQEKGSLQALVGGQSHVISELEAQLNRATGNSTALQRQQQEMMDTVHNLLNLCSKDGGRFHILQQPPALHCCSYLLYLVSYCVQMICLSVYLSHFYKLKHK